MHSVGSRKYDRDETARKSPSWCVGRTVEVTGPTAARIVTQGLRVRVATVRDQVEAAAGL